LILIDTSVWIAHLRTRDEALATLLAGQEVLVHPFVIGELAAGNLRQRGIVLSLLDRLSRPQFASDAEVPTFIEQHKLMGLGVGYIDVHLLAATGLTAGASFWTIDRRSREVAERLGLAARIRH
jgi:predicted nucleic acid-binding protein